jgi:hypothetical protein
MWAQVLKFVLFISVVAALIGWTMTRGARDAFPAAGRLWKRLALVSWIVGATGMAGLLIMLNGYPHPVEPDPATGRTHAYNNHGAIYLTDDELRATRFFETIGVGGVAGLLGMIYIVRRQQQAVDDRKYIRPGSR